MKDVNFYQKYLFDTDYTDVHIVTIFLEREDCNQIQNYDAPYNIFDCNSLYRRKISVSVLDSYADTNVKFNKILRYIDKVDELFLINDRITVDNPIIQSYSDCTLKAYVKLFMNNGIKNVYVASVA